MTAKTKSILVILVIVFIVLWLAGSAFKMAFGLLKFAVIAIVVLIVAGFVVPRLRR